VRILYFHQHFATPQGSAGTRSYEFAQALSARGHQVTVVCGAHQHSGLQLPFDPQANWSRGKVGNFEVISLPLEYSNRDSLLRRAMIFLKFAARSIKLALTEDYDLIFVTSTPITAVLPGLAGKWFRGKPMVFEVRDLWPELPRALGMKNPLVLGAMSALEWLGYHSADACIGLSPGIVAGIAKRAPVGQKIYQIPNGADLELFHPRLRQSISLPGIQPQDFVVGFTGAHGPANGLDALLATARELHRRGRRDVKIAFIGDGKEKDRLANQAREEGLTSCLFYKPVPKDELAKLTASFGAGLMILKNIPAFYEGTSPNKFFDYASAGIPVINNYPGWLAALIQEYQAGLVIPPDDPVAMADALERLADDAALVRTMGMNARRLAEERFSRRELAQQFVQVLEHHAD
jgi:glycosyltransferase involved in cell wall biosynthesis